MKHCCCLQRDGGLSLERSRCVRIMMKAFSMSALGHPKCLQAITVTNQPNASLWNGHLGEVRFLV